MSNIAVAIIPDRQSKLFAGVANAARSSDPSAVRTGMQTDVRRPTRGIVIKEDTFATMRVLLSDGTSLPLVNAGSRAGQMDGDKMKSTSYSNFLIQQVTEERVEKQQIVETFGEAFIFFFGERPRVLNVQGVLVNTFDFNWEAEWWFNYDNYLRGTKCVENDARVYLTFDETMVSGYIMATSSTKQSQERNYVPFAFQLFVTDYTNISRLGDPNPDPNARSVQGQGYDDSIYRPQLVPTYPHHVGEPLTLVEAYLRDAVNTVQKTWSTISMITQNALMSVDSMLGGEIRIPVGFQGALAFDDPRFFPSDVVGLDEPVRFTAQFGDNDDEFVGSSPQYGSAFLDFGTLAQQAFADASSFDSQDAMFAEAKKQWASYGLIVPPATLSKVVTLMQQTGIGMQVLGAARQGVGKVTDVTNTALHQGDAVVAGTTNLLSNAALADSVVADVSPETAASIDRAAYNSAQIASGITVEKAPTTQPGVNVPTIVSAGTPDPSFQGFVSNLSQQSAQQRLNALKSTLV